MKRLNNFLTTSILGGLLVILPATIVVAIFMWMFHTLADFLAPFTNVLTETTQIGGQLAHFIAIILLFVVCFFLGVLVRTNLGSFVYKFIENNIFYNFPLYKIVKEAITQFFGGNAQFSRVALVKPFDDSAMTTAFITASHSDGSYTVFVPTAPNPTSGLIFHLPGNRVFPTDVSVDKAMRTVLSCGAGSQILLEKIRK
ncbi:MAG: hypothetical protein A4S09_16665 [Proteobacteria bacterium SG_bin7]|nr:MAG: hypothetical protein A4S09_16665 [Proteobacteria bacterium SG_bin7]